MEGERSLPTPLPKSGNNWRGITPPTKQNRKQFTRVKTRCQAKQELWISSEDFTRYRKTNSEMAYFPLLILWRFRESLRLNRMNCHMEGNEDAGPWIVNNGNVNRPYHTSTGLKPGCPTAITIALNVIMTTACWKSKGIAYNAASHYTYLLSQKLSVMQGKLKDL